MIDKLYLLPWADFKTFVDTRGLSIQWISSGGVYWLQAYVGQVCENCSIKITNPADTDQADFEMNYKNLGNVETPAKVFVNNTGSSIGPATIKPLMLEMTLARGTSIPTTEWTTAYSYTGSGLLFGFLLTLEFLSSDWIIRLIRDDIDIFSTEGFLTSGLSDHNVFGFNRDYLTFPGKGFGITLKTNTLFFESPLSIPVLFNSKIEIKIKRVGSAKKFKAGLISLQKGI